MASGGQDALKQEGRVWAVLAVGGHGPRALSQEHDDRHLPPLQLPWGGVPTPFHSSRLPAHNPQPVLSLFNLYHPNLSQALTNLLPLDPFPDSVRKTAEGTR